VLFVIIFCFVCYLMVNKDDYNISETVQHFKPFRAGQFPKVLLLGLIR